MPKFLILYEEPRLVITPDRGSYYEQEGHALVVEAAHESDAFVMAFDYLSRRGHMVRTIKPGENVEDLQRSQEEQRSYNPDVHIQVIAGMSLDQMLQVWNAGVPVIGGRGDHRKMTTLLKIAPYTLECTGKVLSE